MWGSRTDAVSSGQVDPEPASPGAQQEDELIRALGVVVLDHRVAGVAAAQGHGSAQARANSGGSGGRLQRLRRRHSHSHLV